MKTLISVLRLLAILMFVIAAQSCATQRNFIEAVYYGDSDSSEQLAQKQAAKPGVTSTQQNQTKVTQ